MGCDSAVGRELAAAVEKPPREVSFLVSDRLLATHVDYFEEDTADNATPVRGGRNNKFKLYK